MIFIEVEQGSPEWFRARLGRATASRFKDIMAVSKRDGSPLKARDDYKKELVTERILGEVGKREVFITPEMLWGQQNEALARTNYQLMTGNKVTGEGFVQHDTLMAGVSVDGLVNKEGNLEIKCPAPHNYLFNIAYDAAMPDDYFDQVQGQLWITERQWCDFVGYDSRMPAGLDLFVVRVERDEEHIAKLAKAVTGFLAEVEADFNHFMRYLPLAERVCRACGQVFTAQINLCPNCLTNACIIRKVVTPAEVPLTKPPTVKPIKAKTKEPANA